jgi:hypothetical protein
LDEYFGPLVFAGRADFRSGIGRMGNCQDRRTLLEAKEWGLNVDQLEQITQRITQLRAEETNAAMQFGIAVGRRLEAEQMAAQAQKEAAKKANTPVTGEPEAN